MLRTNLKAFDLDVLLAVWALQPEAYGNTIRDWVARGRWFPSLNPSLARVYFALSRLEIAGFLRSEWSEKTYPERGNRKRLYWFLTKGTPTDDR